MKNKTDRYSRLSRLHKLSFQGLFDPDSQGGQVCDPYDRLCNNREWIWRNRRKDLKLSTHIDRLFREVIAFFDPTGISGWSELATAKERHDKNPTKDNRVQMAHAVVGATPAINKAAKGIGIVSTITQSMYNAARDILEDEGKEAL